MEYALKVMLYQPPASLRQTPALQQGAQAPGARQLGQQGGVQVISVPWLLLSSHLSPVIRPLCRDDSNMHLRQDCKTRAS